MKRILILGASGMVGTALEEVAQEHGWSAIGVTAHRQSEGMTVDVTQQRQVTTALEYFRPSAVVNCVAIVGINPCEQRPAEAFEMHGTAVSHLARECDRLNIKYIQFSSHAVFNGEKVLPYDENDPVSPTSIYAVSKVTSELFSLNQCRLSYVIRLPTMFGFRRNKSFGFVEKITAKLKSGEEVKVADDKIDSPTFAVDAANQIFELLNEERPFGLYHVANAGMVSYFDFISEIRARLKLTSLLTRAKDSDFPGLAPKPLRTSLTSVKLKPLRAWEEALGDFLHREKK